MRTTKTRALGMILALAMLLGMFTACGQKTPDSTTPSTNSGAQTNGNAGGEEKEEPVEITVMVYDRGDNAPGTTLTDNATTKYIQEHVLEEKNVIVNFVGVPRTEAEDKLTAMLAGGTAPDLVMSYERDLFLNYASKGGLKDLTDLIEEYGQNLKQTLEDTNYAGRIDGRQYAVMTSRSRQQTRHMAYIRQDWLDALGLSVPTTVEELIDTLYQFKEKDPGNLGENNIPYGMGGRQVGEQYLMFVSAYSTDTSKESKYLYNESTRMLMDGCQEGFRVLNQMYNDGIISKDFAVDTQNEKFGQDIANGYVGFFIDDIWREWDLGDIGALRQINPDAKYVPVNIFTNADGVIENVAISSYGAYKMVPATTSDEKAAAVVKYLDWLAVEENALSVQYTPEYSIDEDGIPVGLSDAEIREKGYAITSGDFNIITQNFDFNNDLDKLTTSYLRYDWKADFSREEVYDLLEAHTSNLINWPVYETTMPNNAKYGAAVKAACVEMAYKAISAAPGQFDKVYEEEYSKVMQAGFDKMLEENQAYCDQYLG